MSDDQINRMKLSQFRSVLFLYVSMLFILACFRLANYIAYHDYFAGSIDVMTILFTSVRFDLMTASYVLLLPTLLILTPAKGRIASMIKGTGLQLGLVMLMLSTIALMGDFIYFGVVNRHTFNDLPLLMTETSFIIPFLGSVDLCCTNVVQQYIGSHININASDTILA